MLLFMSNRKQRRTDVPDPTKGDLVLPTGTFLITETGVMCQLRPPLARLSGHYTWAKTPMGLAVLRVLVLGDDNDDVCSKLVKLIGFSDDELDMFEVGIGKDCSAYLAQDVGQVLSWAPALASRCPMSSVAHDLRRLKSMPPEDLGDFVAPLIGLA